MTTQVEKQPKPEKIKIPSQTMTTLPRMCQSCDSTQKPTIVEFQPEELDYDFTPLKVEEADEHQLAEFLEGNGLSFLFEKNQSSEDVRKNSPSNHGKSKRKKAQQPPTKKIRRWNPAEDGDDKINYRQSSKGSKRMRLSHRRQ